MDEPSDAIGNGIELHSMMNAAPTMEEVTMEETIPTTEPETIQPGPSPAVVEELIEELIEEEEEEEQGVSHKKQEASSISEHTSTVDTSNNAQENSEDTTNINDVTTTLNNHQLQRNEYNSCILSQTSMEMEKKVIDSVVELEGKFVPTVGQKDCLVDKDIEVEHIQREIIGERSVLPENSVQSAERTNDHEKHQEPEKADSSSKTKNPTPAESLPQLPDLTKVAHEIVPEITTLENTSFLKIQEIDQEKLNEKSIVLEKVVEVMEKTRYPKSHLEGHPSKPQTAHFSLVSEQPSNEPLDQEDSCRDPSSPTSILTDQHEKESATEQAQETKVSRKEQKGTENLEMQKPEQIFGENRMAECEESLSENQEKSSDEDKPVFEKGKKTQEKTKHPTNEAEKVEDDAKQEEIDSQARSGRPVRAVRNRASKRLASPDPEEPKIKPEKRQKRASEQMERDLPTKSPSLAIKGPIKLTLRTPSSRTTIATSAPSKKVEKPKKQATLHSVVDDKRYKCDDCPFSTDRLNNIVMHKHKYCPNRLASFNRQLDAWKRTLSSPKSNSKRFSR